MSQPLVLQVLFGLTFGALLLRLGVMAFRGSVPRNRAFIWAVLWSLGLLLVLNPSLSFYLARLLGVTRGTDAVVYTAIAFLSIMIFRAFQLSDTLDRQVSRLTTELALYEWESRRGGLTDVRSESVEPGTPRDASPPARDEDAPR